MCLRLLLLVLLLLRGGAETVLAMVVCEMVRAAWSGVVLLQDV